MNYRSILLIAGIVVSVSAAPAPVPEPVPEPIPTGLGTGDGAAPTATPSPNDASSEIPPEFFSWLRTWFQQGARRDNIKPRFEAEPEEDYTIPNRENGIKENTNCEPLTVIFSHGANEDGNMGSVVGPSLADSLRSALYDRVTIQGVDYQDTPQDTVQVSEYGGPAMAELVKQSLSQCPESKIALAGYSQGATVVRHAIELVEAERVAAVILFGDPLKDIPFEKVPREHIKQFCAKGDPVCLNGDDSAAHKSYARNAEEAAQFLVKTTGAD